MYTCTPPVQLGVWGSAVSSPRGVWGGALKANAFCVETPPPPPPPPPPKVHKNCTKIAILLLNVDAVIVVLGPDRLTCKDIISLIFFFRSLSTQEAPSDLSVQNNFNVSNVNFDGRDLLHSPYDIGLPAVLIKAGDRFDLKYLYYSVTQTLQEQFQLSRKL